MHLTNDLKNGIDELVENQEEVIEALKGADHFYICHYCKKREQIEHRRCYLSLIHISEPTSPY